MKATLKIGSESFKNQGFIPSKYTCEGENINPALIISGLPMATKTLALIVEDPDAPEGNFVHWVVWNISPTNKIRENIIPGEEGLNDFNNHHYSGPCPPSGTHRYIFKIYALDNFLHLNPKCTKADLEAAMDIHIIGVGELIGQYKKKK
ncbi:MAG: YbhB/YbcL family Raf kinase inhibitor-like protein [Chitinophagales bacterium]